MYFKNEKSFSNEIRKISFKKVIFLNLTDKTAKTYRTQPLS